MITTILFMHVGLGLLSKSVPQMNIFALSLSINILVAFVVLALSNREIMSPNHAGRVSKLRQINEAGGAATEPNHDARYRVFDAIGDNIIAIRIIERLASAGSLQSLPA